MACAADWPAPGVAFITGGGSGLGLATAQAAVAKGWRVAVADRDAAEGQKAADSLGANALFCLVDVTDGESVKKALAATMQRFGSLDLVVNCAGIGAAIKTVSGNQPHSPEVFDMVVKVNLYGTFNVCSQAAAIMSQLPPKGPNKARGLLVNVASVAAFEGTRGQIAYSASKGGVHAMTLPMARDLAKAGIRVVCIAPGIFDTPMLARASDEARAKLVQDVTYPPRLGCPTEFAKMVFAFWDNQYLNAITVRVDGGIRMSAL